MSAERIAVLACGLCIGAAAVAGGEEAVDTAFLEYLGEWEDEEADWRLFEDIESRAASERDEPEEKQAPERDDES